MTITNLPSDLLEEIFSRLPLNSMRAVRLACKTFYTLSKCKSFAKLHFGKETATTKEGESQMILLMDYNLYLISVVVDGDPYIECKGKLTWLNNSEQVEISQVIHFEGLMLCILKKDTRLVVWNPYWGQTRWIEPRYSHHLIGCERFSYALGYVGNISCRSHKLLRFIDYFFHGPELEWYEIYDFESGLWTTLDVTPHWCISLGSHGISIKGNTYWSAITRNSCSRGLTIYDHDHIICFDFTSERFGPLLPLPLNAEYYGDVILSSVKEEKLAVLQQQNRANPYMFDIWITINIESDHVSWTKFLKVDMETVMGTPFTSSESFFIDEKNKIAMGFDETLNPYTISIFGEAGYYKQVNLEQHANTWSRSQMCTYVPSLLQIKQLHLIQVENMFHHLKIQRKKKTTLESIDIRYDENMLDLLHYGEA